MFWFHSFVAVFIVSFAFLLHTLLEEGPIKAVSYRPNAPPQLDGPLFPNLRLQNVEQLLKGELLGPESIEVHPKTGKLYTGLRTGEIVEVSVDGFANPIITRKFYLHDKMQSVKCGTYEASVKCGRPLGVRLLPNNSDILIVADAYYGIFELNVINGYFKCVLPIGAKITTDSTAAALNYVNDFDILPNGSLIISEPTTTFKDRDFLYAMLEHRPNGRLLHFDPAHGTLSVLVDELYIPNGVLAESNAECVFYAEMGNLRIMRYCLNAAVERQKSVLIDNLPGYPDNIRYSRDGTMWIPFGGIRNSDDSWITTNPWFRNLLVKLTTPIMLLRIVELLSPRYGLILRIDPSDGKILESLHDPTADKVSSVSQVTETKDGTLYFGSDSGDFIGKLPSDVRFR
ncbi:hypothetical protein AB6A40_000115 [Gnathostoma spinigerum]|uniref:Strictosidine synthase conserved region domain-containing protein n=1 Tax=Gnathostoma spinigerum TaxID=75299 RepID=A0ABD6E7Q7_9BILA